MIRLEVQPVAVYQQGKVYPVISDHLGSIRAQFSPDGKTLLWERHYGPWGEKTTLINPALSGPDKDLATKLEKSTLWSYALLMEQPGVSSAPAVQVDGGGISSMPLYWSESRVYSPALREWLSVDPIVRWNPQSLLDKPGNWHSVKVKSNIGGI